jgi:hypothetical protein
MGCVGSKASAAPNDATLAAKATAWDPERIIAQWKDRAKQQGPSRLRKWKWLSIVVLGDTKTRMAKAIVKRWKNATAIYIDDPNEVQDPDIPQPLRSSHRREEQGFRRQSKQGFGGAEPIPKAPEGAEVATTKDQEKAAAGVATLQPPPGEKNPLVSFTSAVANSFRAWISPPRDDDTQKQTELATKIQSVQVGQRGWAYAIGSRVSSRPPCCHHLCFSLLCLIAARKIGKDGGTATQGSRDKAAGAPSLSAPHALSYPNP